MSQNHTLSHRSCITKHFYTSLTKYSKSPFFKVWRYIVLSEYLTELFTQLQMEVRLK